MEFKVYLRKINYNLAKDNNILKLKKIIIIIGKEVFCLII